MLKEYQNIASMSFYNFNSVIYRGGDRSALERRRGCNKKMGEKSHLRK